MRHPIIAAYPSVRGSVVAIDASAPGYRRSPHDQRHEVCDTPDVIDLSGRTATRKRFFMSISIPYRGFLALVVCLAGIHSALAQEVPVIEHELENGLKILMVPRPGDPNISAGWIARVGSVYESPGITGVAHLFEHMMFKGTQTIGTSDIGEDLEIIEQLDALKAELYVEEAQLLHAHRLGEIEDPHAPDARSPRHVELLEGFRPADRTSAGAAHQGGLQPRVYRAGCVRDERGHQLRLHDLFHQCSGQQARAMVLDGGGPASESGVPGVLLRTGRRTRGTPAPDRQHAHRKVPGAVRRDVLGVVTL